MKGKKNREKLIRKPHEWIDFGEFYFGRERGGRLIN
jgi:hypothetical protein